MKKIITEVKEYVVEDSGSNSLYITDARGLNNIWVHNHDDEITVISERIVGYNVCYMIGRWIVRRCYVAKT